MESTTSEFIRQVIEKENYNFEKVITDVADGFKRCGFFDKTDWKNLLEQCFGRKRLGLTSQEILIYSSVLSDSSYEGGFVDSLVEATPLAESTPFTSVPIRNSSLKRTSTIDQQNIGKKRKRTTNSTEDVGVALMGTLKKADWSTILPVVNIKQKAVEYVTVFERSKQLKEANSASKTARSNVASTIKNRRNAIYKPSAKKSTDPVLVPVTQPLAEPVGEPGPNLLITKKSTATITTTVTTAVPENNAVLANITNRRSTRRQTRLMAAYTGTAITSTTDTDRRSNSFQRTPVLFTMIDTSQYKDILTTYNIFVADSNEKYDYLIAGKICRSPKFLSAVVSGKPIVSIDWIHALNEKKIWLDPLHYLLKDDEGEKEYSFHLSDTLQMATNKKLFEKFSILVTPKITITPSSLKDVIFSGGGKFLKTSLVPRRGDEVICVSDEKDKKMWPKLLQKYPTLKKIISLDGFSKMIFQYTHDVSPADILHQI